MPSPAHPSFQAAPTAAIPAYLHPQAVAVTLRDRARKRIERITQNVTRLWVDWAIAGHGF
jgi:16S rRNA C967 or C1407 C5-methylase (RsmB/RsmF family)